MQMETSKDVRVEGPCLCSFIFWEQNVSSQLGSYPGCAVVTRAVSHARAQVLRLWGCPAMTGPAEAKDCAPS